MTATKDDLIPEGFRRALRLGPGATEEDAGRQVSRLVAQGLLAVAGTTKGLSSAVPYLALTISDNLWRARKSC